MISLWTHAPVPNFPNVCFSPNRTFSFTLERSENGQERAVVPRRRDGAIA